jgi:acyl-coenzyme A thioesterase PaaI-like protein
MTAARIKRLINWYPPYLGAGIRATRVSDDFRYIRVEMRLRWYNRNYVGTHFGGSLFAMADPFLMLMAIHNLGRQYVVWDRSATIEFAAPGRGVVSAEFTLSEADLEAMREATAGGDKYLPCFDVNVVDEQGTVVARIHKELYVRRTRESAKA